MSEINELVIKAKSGDKNSWDELIRIYQLKLNNYCKKWFKKTEDTEEAVQEILLLCYKKINQVKEPEKFEGWLFTIAMNKCNEICNKNKRNILTISDSNTEDDVLSILQNFEDNDQYIYPEASLERKEQYKTLLSILNDIPKEQKVCFSLRIICNKSFNEIADKTGVSVPTAKSRYLYAKKTLKKKILAYEKENNCKLHRGIALSPSLLFKYLFVNNTATSFLGVLSGINGGIAALAIALTSALVTTIALNAPAIESSKVIDNNFSSTSSTESAIIIIDNKNNGNTSPEPSSKSEKNKYVYYGDETSVNHYSETEFEKTQPRNNNKTQDKTEATTKTTNVNKTVPTYASKNTTEPTTSTAPYFVTSGMVYFERPDSWRGSNFYCHIYDADTEESFFNWQEKKEKLSLVESNKYSYDLSIIKESDSNNQRLESNRSYRIIISDNYGNTIQDLIFDTSYLNRTIVVTGVSEKDSNISPDSAKEYIGRWK